MVFLGSECGNKKLRYDMEHHTRKDSNLHAHTDLFVRAMATGDVEVGNIMFENNKKGKEKPSKLPTLPTAARPLIENPEDFIFMDIGKKYASKE